MKPLSPKEFETLIEAQRMRLQRCLDEQFGRLSLHQLGLKVGEIEGWTVAYLKKVLWDLSPVILGCNKCTQPDHILDEQLGAVFEICVGRDVQASQNLTIAFVQKHVPTDAEPQRREFSFDSFGPFSMGNIFVPPLLSSKTDDAVRLVKAVIEGSGQWTTDAVSTLVFRQQNHLAKRIYRKLRSAIGNETLLSNLRVGCVTDKYGFSFIDPQGSESASRIFQRNKAIHGYSVNRMLAELISTRLPCGDLLMNLARSAHQAIDGDMRQARYRQEGTIYAEVMAGLYAGDAFSILPIFIDSIFAVFALVPTENRSAIEPIVAANSQSFSLMIRSSRDAIVKAQWAFEKWEGTQASTPLITTPEAEDTTPASSELPKKLCFVERTRTVKVDQFEVHLGPSHFALLWVLAESFSNVAEEAKHFQVTSILKQKLEYFLRTHPQWFNEQSRALVKTLEQAAANHNTSPLSKLLYDLRRRLGEQAIQNRGAKRLSEILPKGPGCNLKLPSSAITFK